MLPLINRYGGKILIGLVLAAMLAGIVGIWMPYQQELRITFRVKQVGGEVVYRFCGPTWLPRATERYLFVFDRVEQVEFFGDATPADVLAELRLLSRLEQIDFTHSEITDDLLRQVSELTRLRMLSLRHTKITDQGLVHLKGLRKLVFLQLDDTEITDAGLDHLAGLSSLRSVRLVNTQTTPEGRDRLRDALGQSQITPNP